MTTRKHDQRYCAKCGSLLHGRSLNQYCRKNPDCRTEFLRDKWTRTDYARKAYDRARDRAKKRGEPFTITITDLPPIPIHCPALGIELSTTNNVTAANSVSLDCIAVGKGYVLGNIQWLSYKANSMKRDASQEELESFAKWILKE